MSEEDDGKKPEDEIEDEGQGGAEGGDLEDGGDGPGDGEEGNDAAARGEEGDDLEAMARRQGWKPESEWRGKPPPGGLMSAEEYLDYADRNIGVLKDRLRRQDGEISRLTKTLEDFDGWRSRVEKRAYEKALKEVRAKMRAAADEGDVEAFDAADKELEGLTKKADDDAGKGKDGEPEIEPEVKEWVKDNRWFETDPVMKETAIAVHGQLLKEKPGLSLTENLEATAKEIKKRFPEKFSNPNRRGAPRVEGAGAGGGKSGRSYGDLPAEAKKACNDFVAEGLMTKEEYVKDYFEQE